VEVKDQQIQTEIIETEHLQGITSPKSKYWIKGNVDTVQFYDMMTARAWTYVDLSKLLFKWLFILTLVLPSSSVGMQQEWPFG